MFTFISQDKRAINNNFGRISYRFRDIDAQSYKK